MATTHQANKTQIMTGADILVQSLVDHGVEVLFAYPGGASMPLHQALTRFSDRLRTILPRHEQGGGFAAQGYARSTGKVGVVMATSGPGATNLVTAIADAKLDSVPHGGDHGASDDPRDRFGRFPGDADRRSLPRDHQAPLPGDGHCRAAADHEGGVSHRHDGTPGSGAGGYAEGYPAGEGGRQLGRAHELAGLPRLDSAPSAVSEQIKQVAAAIKLAKRPVLYCGGGVISANASDELRIFARKTGIPVAMTLMGLGAFPSDDPLCLDMLGMHGSVYANWAIRDCDLLLALGVRFDDRVTGKLEAFAKHAKIIHIDIDPSELNKNKPAHFPIVSDVKYALQALIQAVEAGPRPG